jgi:hypothetical protein
MPDTRNDETRMATKSHSGRCHPLLVRLLATVVGCNRPRACGAGPESGRLSAVSPAQAHHLESEGRQP